MKTTKLMLAVILALLMVYGCEKDSLTGDLGLNNGTSELFSNGEGGLKSMKTSKLKATGSVQFAWKGGEKGGEKGNKPEALLAFLDFNAHEGIAGYDAKGEIVYRVTKLDSTLHREIRAEVFDVLVDTDLKKAYIIAMVVADTKGCGGNGSDGHDEGCSDGGTDEGGCSHDDTGGSPGGETDEGGCSHDDTGGSPGGETDEGGCSDGGTDVVGTTDDATHDGGCSHDDTGEVTDEGGCSDSGTDEGHTGEEGSGSSSSKGNPLSGKNCRIGQLMVIKVHDVGTPGTAGDGLTWKWFSAEGDFVPSTTNITLWPHLCKKTILSGNLVVHN